MAQGWGRAKDDLAEHRNPQKLENDTLTAQIHISRTLLKFEFVRHKSISLKTWVFVVVFNRPGVTGAVL